MEEKKQITKFTFYDLYAELMDTLTDEERGKLLRAMCAYAFENAPPAFTDKKLVYLWGNIVDTLTVDITAQESGRTPKGLNRQMKHFMFHRNFYEALPLMDDKQAGQFAKAIYNFAFKEQEPKLASPVDTYYKLAKRKLQLSKTRSKVGEIGGNAPRVKVTDKQVLEKMNAGMSMAFEKFMWNHPQITNDLYRSSLHLADDIDWSMLDYCLPLSQLRRVSEIDIIIKKLYEDNVTVKISDERFEKLTETYEAEQADLRQTIDFLRKEIAVNRDESEAVTRFMKLVQKYTDIEELDAEIVRTFIEKIYVYEAVQDGDRRKQQLQIVYNCVGVIDIPEEKSLAA